MFDSKDPNTLKSLENILNEILNNFTSASINGLALKVYDAGLLEPILPWYIKIIQFIRKFDNYTTLKILFDLRNDIAVTYIKGLIDHLVNGFDTYDSSSAGGFSQDEIEKLVEILNPYVVELHKSVSGE